jgi:hypothetical protein
MHPESAFVKRLVCTAAGMHSCLCAADRMYCLYVQLPLWTTDCIQLPVVSTANMYNCLYVQLPISKTPCMYIVQLPVCTTFHVQLAVCTTA